MKLTCPDCDTVYNIPRERIGKKVRRASCRFCGASIPLDTLQRELEEDDNAEVVVHSEDRTVIKDLPELHDFEATPALGLASRPQLPHASPPGARVAPLTVATEVALWDLRGALNAPRQGESVSDDAERPILESLPLKIQVMLARAPAEALATLQDRLPEALMVLPTLGRPEAVEPPLEDANHSSSGAPLDSSSSWLPGIWRSARAARVKRPSRLPAPRRDLPPILQDVIQRAEGRRRLAGRAITAAFIVATVLMIVNCT